LTSAGTVTKFSLMKQRPPGKHPITVRRKALKLSGYRLALIAGISPQHLFAIEKGEIRLPRVDVAMRIADALGAKVGDLFPGVAA